jgi:DnaK suppressor protein
VDQSQVLLAGIASRLTCVNHRHRNAFENFRSSTRRTMDLPTQTHLKTLRELLSYRLAELRAEVRAAESARRESAEPGAHDVLDRKDEAAQQQVATLGGAQERRDLDEVADVESALHRLDIGSYGDCAQCGDPIALARLLVQPAALRCAACQQAHERAQHRSR